jgi:hypothetical protein
MSGSKKGWRIENGGRRVRVRSILQPLSSILIFATIGCASATQSGHNTALDSVDLVKMTDDMAMRIASDPDVQREYQANGPLKVVVEPVENEMTGEVLPRGPAETFTSRVRMLLSKHAPQTFTWVMNRDAYYRLRGRELEADLGPNPDAVNPQYALTAKFSSLTSEDATRRSSYYLCVYSLTALSHRNVLWTGQYEVKKAAVKGFLD